MATVARTHAKMATVFTGIHTYFKVDVLVMYVCPHASALTAPPSTMKGVSSGEHYQYYHHHHHYVDNED